MDTTRFDALVRTLGRQRNRRDTLTGLIAGLAGIGGATGVVARVTVEASTCGERCRADGECNGGLRCSVPSGSLEGSCIALADSGTSCTQNIDCPSTDEVCRDRRCVNQVSCSRCVNPGDCQNGLVCRNGECRECTRDPQCPGTRQICLNGRCQRNRPCDRNRDCRSNERCRNGRCVLR